MAKANYYEVLHLPRNETFLSPERVKKAYRTTLLSHHPDKAKAGAGTGVETHTVTIDEIALAYKTLSEPSLRAEYDRWLTTSQDSDDLKGGRIHHTGLETVDLDDLAFDEKSQSWSRDCRCGVGGYAVTEDELEKHLEDREIIVGCRGCSLWLRVLFSVEE